MSDAERVRQFALESFVNPARAKGFSIVAIAARDVNKILGLSGHYRNICQALRGKKFLQIAGVDTPEIVGHSESSTTIFVYRILD